MRWSSLADEIDEIVGAEVPFLAQEHVDDLLPLAGALAAGRLQPAEIRKRSGTLPSRRVDPDAVPLTPSHDAERRAAAARRRRVRVLDREAAAGHGVDEIDFGALEIADADRVDEQPDAVRLVHLIAGAAALFDHQPVLEARAAAALHEYAQAAAGLALFGEQLVDLRRCRWGHVDHGLGLLDRLRL